MGQSKHKRNRDCRACGRSYNMTAREFSAHKILHDITEKARGGGFTEKNEIKLRGFKKPNSPLSEGMAKVLKLNKY